MQKSWSEMSKPNYTEEILFSKTILTVQPLELGLLNLVWEFAEWIL